MNLKIYYFLKIYSTIKPNTNNLNYIGSSASLVLINSDKIITMDLGITKCFLLDKDGNILNLHDKEEEQNDENEKKENDKIIIEHIFNNIEEKKRIKNFNKEIDYESLKLNNYIPASRSFGFFKYKFVKLNIPSRNIFFGFIKSRTK